VTRGYHSVLSDVSDLLGYDSVLGEFFHTYRRIVVILSSSDVKIKAIRSSETSGDTQ